MANEPPISALPVPDEGELDPDLQKYFAICREKLGLVPNVLKAYSFRPERLRRFIDSYNEIMLSDGPLSKLEREMIAVVVSAYNRCTYCLVAHGQAVRALSGQPELGEMLVMNYRAAPLDARQRDLLDRIEADRAHIKGLLHRAMQIGQSEEGTCHLSQNLLVRRVGQRAQGRETAIGDDL